MPKTKKKSKVKSEKQGKIYSDEDLVAYCGINCKDCRERGFRRSKLGQEFKKALEELPLDVFKQLMPGFEDIDKVMKFLDTFGNFTAMQTCCTCKDHPCGDPQCQIRTCVKKKGYRTCAECSDYQSCSKLDFLKPHHETLISDLDYIKENGFNNYSKEIVGKFKLQPISID